MLKNQRFNLQSCPHCQSTYPHVYEGIGSDDLPGDYPDWLYVSCVTDGNVEHKYTHMYPLAAKGLENSDMTPDIIQRIVLQ